ncbi:MAG: AbrB/MazE/SpoVT family DNA-binding domain-containing protein [Haloarculaceae archaeon]
MGEKTERQSSSAKSGRDGRGETLELSVDDRGRMTIPKRIRDQLGIEPNATVSARLDGSVLTVDPRPSTALETATADRDDWDASTPMDAGEALFGSLDADDE